MPLGSGDRLGSYEIVAPLGAGGMGEVYRARDERLGRDVAVKVLPAEFATDSERQKRFESEARATAALSHPNILAVYDVGRHDGVPYLVEELLEGESLKDAVDRGALGVAEATRVATEMAKGLAAAHEKGIVHRDLKPANVFIARDGTVKILDFGLAKRLPTVPQDEVETLTWAQTATSMEGGVLGTVAYMAPEQVRGQRVDQRADVFALGIVLYEMLAGQRPFRGTTATAVVVAILETEPAPLPANVQPALAGVVTRCLAKDPEGRYQRGSDVRAALEAVQSRASDAGALRSWRQGGHAASARAVRLAVLPFANLSGDPEQEYLSDGLTQEMITQLGRLHPESLSVIARASVMRYKKGDTPIDQIGRELAVEWVLEGSARREANLVRITAQLIHVREQTQRWADSYDRDFASVLMVQGEVARKVAEALALELLPAEQARLASVRPVNPEAYEAYLKGFHHWQKVTPADLDTAQRYFELALERDPSYAPAHEGLAWVWAARQQMGFASPSECGPKAKAAALRAIELDDGSAGAHEALALVRSWIDWDWAGAWPEWRRALEIGPNRANARAYYAHFLAITGLADEAVAHSERAIELDPHNALFHSLYAAVLLYQRRDNDALAAVRAAVELQPDEPIALFLHMCEASGSGRYADALAAAKAYVNIVCYDHAAEDALEQGWARGGYREAMRQMATTLATRFPTSYVSPYEIAVYYTEAQEHGRALDWLERAYEARDPNLPYLGFPTFDPLRADPRFQDLRRRMNLPAD